MASDAGVEAALKIAFFPKNRVLDPVWHRVCNLPRYRDGEAQRPKNPQTINEELAGKKSPLRSNYIMNREEFFCTSCRKGLPMARTFMPFRNGNFAPLEDLAREVDSLVQNIFDPEERGQHHHYKYTPHANLAETDKAYELTLDLPGINAEEVSVELNDDQLIVSGERRADVEDGKTYHRVERRFGKFRRALTIPVPVNEEGISAEYKDGVLTVTLPKSEKVKPKKISINVN